MDPNSFHHQQQNEVDGGGGAATGSKSGSSYLCRQSSARWIPTGDQIRILRDLYYNYGVRSPSAEQIQRISAKLRQYGKIEGKNVFYWFQNHKARERQKKRLTADHISNSTANKFGSVSAYDSGQFGNAGSVPGDKSFRSGCCFSGGEMTESSTVGWFGLETAFQVTPWPYHCGNIGGQEEIVTPAAAARAIQTLPLFPIHAQEDAEEEHQLLPNSFYCGGGAVGVQQTQEGNMINGYHQSRRGGDGASLELTLNSYFEPPTSM